MSEATPRKPDTKDGVFFSDPELPDGWTRKCVQRSSGQSAGKWDVYVYNPMGRKFRSQNEVRKYLEQIGSELSPELFSFNPYAQASTPGGRRRTPGAPAKPKPKLVKKMTAKVATKVAQQRVKMAKAKSANKPTGEGGPAKLKLKFNFAKKRGRPPTKGVVGRPPSSDGAARVPTKLGRPPAAASTPHRPAPHRPGSGRPKTTPGGPKTTPGGHPPSAALKNAPAYPRTPAAAPPKPQTVPQRRRWSPPESPYELVYERYWQDPWKVLIATIFLSKPTETSPEDVWGDPPPVLECRRARPLLEKFFTRWPTAKAVRAAKEEDIKEMIEPLNLGEKGAQLIMRFSDEYLTKKWKSPTELYGIGRNGSDAYRIFCLGQWKQVRPLDHMLTLYHNWLWTNFKALKLE